MQPDRRVRMFNLLAGLVAAIVLAWMLWLASRVDVGCLQRARETRWQFAPEVPAECVAR